MIKLSFLLSAILTSFVVKAEPVPYVEAHACDYRPYQSPRDYWDQTGTFCYERDNHKYEYKISDMGEIKLRDDGKNVYGEYFDSLSDENRQIVSEFGTYYVRYLALDDAKSGENTPFVVHVFFNWGVATETIYAFGEISPNGDVRLTGYSNSKPIEMVDQRIYYVLRNLFHGRNPFNPGPETDSQTTRDILPAAEVIKHYREKNTKPATPSIPVS